MNRPAIAFVSALTILSCASAASAQTPSAAEVSLARDEFRAGVAAAQATQWAEALRAFTRSYQLFPRPLTLLNLAGAQAATNHLVSAAESYRMFLRQAAGPSEAPHRAASEQQLAAIERRIPRARIAIENLVPEDSLALDGLPLSQIVLASAFPMDPGHHVLVVSRNGQEIGRTEFDVGERTTREVALRVPVRTAAVAHTAPTSATTTTTRVSTATVPQPVDRDTGPGAAPAVLVVAGVLAIGGGIALYLVRNNYLTQLDAQCSAGEMARCPASAEASYNSAVLFNALSITAFGVGGVATLIGSAWWLLAPRSRVEVHPQPTLGGMMLHVSTRF